MALGEYGTEENVLVVIFNVLVTLVVLGELMVIVGTMLVVVEVAGGYCRGSFVSEKRPRSTNIWKISQALQAHLCNQKKIVKTQSFNKTET